MRIITGSRRGRKLQSLPGNDVRPTADRVKESLFNILQFRIEGRSFLDLYAGSGQIGLEALSRGAKRAVFVDNRRASQEVIRGNIKITGFEDSALLVSSDAAVYLKSTGETFDIAFLDPPYYAGELEAVLELTAARVKDTGIIICEHPENVELLGSFGRFRKQKSYRYGKIYLTAYEIPGNGE